MRTKPALEMSDVAKMMAAAKAEAKKQNWDLAISIVNESGYILMVDRMESIDGMTGDVATAKARTAALTKRPSKAREEMLKERPGAAGCPGALFGLQGGLPIMYDGHGVGGIGASGRPSHEEEQRAQAGLDALK